MKEQDVCRGAAYSILKKLRFQTGKSKLNSLGLVEVLGATMDENVRFISA